MRQVLIAVLALAGFPASGQTIFRGGVGNAANFNETIAAHSIAVVAGENLSIQTCQATVIPLPRILCGVRVTINDDSGNSVDAPLYFVSPSQINFQVPISLGRLTLCVGAACVPIVVDPQAPAIFEFILDGEPVPIITHLDGSLVTPDNPAENDEILVLYATGMGLDFNTFGGTVQIPADGEAAPGNPPVEYAPAQSSIQVGNEGPFGGTALVVLFQGLAPGLVSLAQFNFVVRPDICLPDPGEDSCPFPSGPMPLWINGPFTNSRQVLLHIR